MDKTRLIQQIDNLKNDIQNLINTKKTLQDKNEIKLFNEEKKIKITNLKNLTDELKKILKKEKIEVQNQNELRNVLKVIDNLEYQTSKKLGKAVALDNVKKAKEMREITKNKYLEYLEMEKIYMKYDPLNIPGYIFLHPNILKEYGLCPHMEINTQNENISEFMQNLEKSRFEWLKMQKDEGLLYFNLYNDIVNKVKLNQLYKDKFEIEKLIDCFIKEHLSESQESLYNSSETFIKEWINCSIKTKRLKEKYKNLINNLSILYNETNFEFHNLLSIKYNLQININHFNNESNINSKNSVDDRFQKLLLIDQFNSYIEEYKLKFESIIINEKYIKNTINQLKSDLYIFLTDRKEFYIKTSFVHVPKNKNIQTGKYFKKWTSLSKEEQLERFESFSKYYVSKQVEIYNKNEDLSNTLFELLKNSYISKKMIYRDFTWNIKTGCIEKIKILKYNKENGFLLEFTKSVNNKSVNNKSVENKSVENKSVDNKSVDNKSVDNKSVENKSVENKSVDNKSVDNKSVDNKSDDNKNVDGIKKKVSSRTIINNDTEKIINEEILYFILKKNKNNKKEYKDEFLEFLKIKLKVKKLSINDKNQICKKYDEILQVIQDNKS
jgi:hypothetical protein